VICIWSNQHHCILSLVVSFKSRIVYLSGASLLSLSWKNHKSVYVYVFIHVCQSYSIHNLAGFQSTVILP